MLAGQQIAVALLAAERHRSKFSEGQFVKIALADVAMATMGHLGYIAEAQLADEGRKAIGNHIFGTFGHDLLKGRLSCHDCWNKSKAMECYCYSNPN